MSHSGISKAHQIVIDTDYALEPPNRVRCGACTCVEGVMVIGDGQSPQLIKNFFGLCHFDKVPYFKAQLKTLEIESRWGGGEPYDFQARSLPVLWWYRFLG